MLQCSTCGEWKDESCFGKQSSKVRGYRYSCKDCVNKRAKELRAKQKELGIGRYSEEQKIKKQIYNANYYSVNGESIREHQKTRGKELTKSGYRRTETYRAKCREKYSLEKNNPKIMLRTVYRNAKARCENPKRKDYDYYGGRGIKFLRKSFNEFYEDMIEGYMNHINEYGGGIKYTQLDRIDNDGHYCKENCRWVTAKENNPYNHI